MTLRAPVIACALLACAALVAPAHAQTTTTPSTPGGEEQQPEQQPQSEQPPDGDDTGTSEGGTQTFPGTGEAGADTGGTLPRTGFQVFALTSIGLGLLLAGAALWPTSSWPPPRDPRIRSTPRRQPPPSRRPPARPRTPSSRRSGLA